MKKILLALGAAAVIAGVTSCNGNAGSQSSEDKAFGDSLANAFGQFYGQQAKMQEEQIKAQFGEKFNHDSFVRGIQSALKLDTADVSYMIGYNMGIQAAFQLYQWAQNGVNVDPALLSRAVAKSINDTVADPQTAYMNFQRLNGRVQQKIEERRNAALAAEAEANEKAGAEFIAKAKADDSSIMTTESGLSYKIENPGTEPKVGENCNVEVIYTGRHINGEQFDSSNGKPVSFNVNGVIPGFREGLQLLGKGGKATIYIPGNIAYGKNGAPNGGIGPDETLVFEIEVVDFTQPE